MKCKVLALMLMLVMCWASQSSAQPTRAETKDEQEVGLKPFSLEKVQLAADNFIALENEKHSTNFQVDQVNLKTFVPECVVPLKTDWAPKDRVYRKSVAVICTKSVSDDIFKTWHVYLPVLKQKSKQQKIK